MSNTGQLSLLAGLVNGYTGEKARVAKEALEQRSTQQQQMIQYLGHLATNPNVPAEHQQWALGKIQELAQADPTKKLPKVDMSELPAVNVQQPTRSTQPTLPQMNLKPPAAPGAPSGNVGTAQNGTVNALGNTPLQPPVAPPANAMAVPASFDSKGQPLAAIPAPIASVRPQPQPGDMGPDNVPNSMVGPKDAQGRPTLVTNQPNFDVAPSTSSLTLPAQPQSTVSNTPPPVPISPAGQLHLLTPQDKTQIALADQARTMEALKKQFPDKTPEQLAYYANHGEFQKDEYSLTPGEKRYSNGKEISSNDSVKPGTKSGYEPKMGPGGPIGVIDVATGGMLTPQQVAANPQAKAVLDQAKAESDAQQQRQDDRDEQKTKNAQDLADRNFEHRAQGVKMQQAKDDAQKARPMVDVLDTSEEYMKGGTFTPRQDLALIVRAVRAMNPGTVRLPNTELEMEIKAGSYGDRFGRWFSTATNGTLPDDQRQDLMNVIRTETTKTATTAAENWRDSFKGTKEEEPPTYLRRFEQKAGDNISPEGATHEVYAADGKTLLGHVVSGKFVPLGK